MRELVWPDDFAWLDQRVPAPSEAVTETVCALPDRAECRAALISDMVDFQSVQRTPTNPTAKSDSIQTWTQLVPCDENASLAWKTDQTDLNDTLSNPESMVLLTLLDQRESRAAPIQTGASFVDNHCVRTRTQLVPRKGPSVAWMDDMNDILAEQHLINISKEDQPPTLLQVSDDLHDLPEHIVSEFYAMIVAEWWSDAARLYKIARASIDLSGMFETKDLRYIKAAFWSDGLRNGPGLLKWALAFTDGLSVVEQSKLIEKTQRAKLHSQCSYERLAAHCSNLLIDWLAIETNSAEKPAGFYHLLLKSFPDPASAARSDPIIHLRHWLADKIADKDPALNDPEEFVESLILRAETLGFINETDRERNEPRVMAVSNGNNCKLCPSRVCTSELFGGGAKKCLCFNSSLSIPSTATQAEQDYVKMCRSYLELKANCSPAIKTLKGVKRVQMEDAMIASKNQTASAETKPTVSLITNVNQHSEISDSNAFEAWLHQLGESQRCVHVIGSKVCLNVDVNAEPLFGKSDVLAMISSAPTDKRLGVATRSSGIANRVSPCPTASHTRALDAYHAGDLRTWVLHHLEVSGRMHELPNTKKSKSTAMVVTSGDAHMTELKPIPGGQYQNMQLAAFLGNSFKLPSFSLGYSDMLSTRLQASQVLTWSNFGSILAALMTTKALTLLTTKITILAHVTKLLDAMWNRSMQGGSRAHQVLLAKLKVYAASIATLLLTFSQKSSQMV